MKKNVLIILLILVFGFTGCMKDDDGYSLGKFWVGFGMIEQGKFRPHKLCYSHGQRTKAFSSCVGLSAAMVLSRNQRPKIETENRRPYFIELYNFG